MTGWAGLRLTVVGCSGSVPGPDSPASSYLVEADGFRVLLDLGSGAFGPLQRHVAAHQLDAIVLSHLHPDHCLDLTACLVALRHGPARRASRLPVIAPAGARERLAAAYEPTAWAPAAGGDKWAEVFEFAVPRDGELGPFTVSFARMNHPVPTYAVRLSHGGATLVYSGDTAASDELVALAAGADLLLCDAAGAGDEVGAGDEAAPAGLHLTARQAGEHAARAGAGRLMVTHVPPWGSRGHAAAEASTAFAGPVLAAQPGMIITL
ncbi:MAG: MBL fold metallo-hydrolase [Actinomycetia bacterium]|nr:MBL fold metallo-hydrolase [Actinomycetes bacterium]